MSSERFEMRVPEDLLRRLDEVRGHEPRASFVKRALESALAVPPLESLGPSPSPALLKAAAEESMRQYYVEGTLERAEKAEPVPKPAVPKTRAASGVRPAREFVLDPRQAALNKAKGS